MRNVKDLMEGSWVSGEDRARKGACRSRSIEVKDKKQMDWHCPHFAVLL